MPNRAASVPPVSKKKGRPCRRIRSSGRPAEQHDLRGAVMRQRPGDLRFPPTVDEHQVPRQWHPLQRIDPHPGRGDENPVRPADVALDDDGGIERAAAMLLVAGAMSSTGGGSSIRAPRALAGFRSRTAPARRSAAFRGGAPRSRSSRSGSAMGHVAPRTPRSFADTADGTPAAGRAASVAANSRAARRIIAALPLPGAAGPSPRRPRPGPPDRPAAPPGRSRGYRASQWPARGCARAGTRPISA